MNSYKKVPFFKLVLQFGVGFLIIIFCIEIIISVIKNASFTAMLNQYFYNGNWFFFFERLIIMSVFYGLFMAGYYKFIKK
ncbi:MAG: hypothetical protein R3342_07540 [Lutibacter sp.]|uniref:hypothetical protein n=1 Tax=Lutibacter sp. TaxID=1925666 RepID=UPI00299DBB2A|nr:hypothetical protein [Lutibacter sp.]MDX1829383.1 hypothetical protein [Lutibacter sp.]